jgi:hypothetical protein
VRRVSIALALAVLSVALAAGATAARHATPTLKLKSAKFSGKWRQSHFSGRLVLRGTAGAAMQVHVGWFRKELLGLRKPKFGPGGPFTAVVKVKKGTFRKKIRIPRGLSPGTFVLMGYGQAGAAVASIPGRIFKLGAPPEGVAGKAYASGSQFGPPAKRFPAKQRVIYAKYVMAAFPKITPIVTNWSGPAGSKFKQSARFTSYGYLAIVTGKGKALHPGVWTNVLAAGPGGRRRVIARVSVRVG